MPREDWVISYDIQQAIQRVAVLTWSISNRKSLLQRGKASLEALEDAQLEVGAETAWLKIGDAFDLIQDEDLALQHLTNKEDEARKEVAGLEALIVKEETEVEDVKKVIVQELGNKVQLNMA